MRLLILVLSVVSVCSATQLNTLIALLRKELTPHTNQISPVSTFLSTLRDFLNITRVNDIYAAPSFEAVLRGCPKVSNYDLAHMFPKPFSIEKFSIIQIVVTHICSVYESCGRSRVDHLKLSILLLKWEMASFWKR